LIRVRDSGSIWTVPAEWPVPVVVTTVLCANAPVEIIAATDNRSSFFILISSGSHHCDANKRPLETEVPASCKGTFASFSRSALPSLRRLLEEIRP
jgi:hypothetical protein